jgi:hypothetical protein
MMCPSWARDVRKKKQKCDESGAELNTVASSDRFSAGVCAQRRNGCRRKSRVDPCRQGRQLVLHRGLNKAFHRDRRHAVLRRKLLDLKIALKVGVEGNRWYR